MWRGDADGARGQAGEDGLLGIFRLEADHAWAFAPGPGMTVQLDCARAR